MKNRVFFFWVVLCLLIQPASVACQTPQPKVDLFYYPNERAVLLDHSIQLDGHVYQLLYTTTGTMTNTKLSFTNSISEKGFTENKITGLLILEDGVRIVENEDLIRKVLTLFKVAYVLYQSPPTGPLGYMPDSFAEEMKLVTSIFFYKGIFKDRTSAVLEALRDILSPRVETSGDPSKLAAAVKANIETKSTIEEAIEKALAVEKFANLKKTRDNAKTLSKSLESWKVNTNLGKITLPDNKSIELVNGLELLSLAAELLWTADLQKDRASWLQTYRNSVSGTQQFDAEQVLAVNLVIGESQSAWNQRANIITEFAYEQTTKLATKLMMDTLAKELANWVWKTKGTRLIGHTVNGAISSVFLGFAIGDLLMGLDQLHDHFTVGLQLDDLRKKFQLTREQLQLKAKSQQGTMIKGTDLQAYQAAYMLEALSASREFTQYADGVYATVSEENLLDWLNPVNWFTGKERREAVNSLRELGKNAELDAMENIGSPKMADYGTDQALKRVKLLKLTFDESSASFTKTGATNWFNLNVGFGGKSIWTYNDKTKVINSGQWNLTGVAQGVYKVEAYIPSGKLEKPLASDAQYQIMHAGTATKVTGNQAGAANNWLNLGSYYFSGALGEYIKLTDQTNSPTGSSTVIFDAVRLSPADTVTNPYAYTFPGGLSYSVVIAGEQATLSYTIQNSGVMPWDPAKVTLTPDSANPPQARTAIKFDRVILTGQSFTWQVNIPTSATSNLIQVKYFLAPGGVSQGNPITGFVVVLPPELKNLQNQIIQQIEEWKKQGQQSLENLISDILEEIQKAIARETVNWLNKLLQGCQIPVGLVFSTILFIRISRRQKSRIP